MKNNTMNYAMWYSSCLVLVFVICLPFCLGTPRVVDLSYTYDKRTPNHPKLSKFDLRVVKRGLNKYGVWVELNDFFSSEHSGTHMDAPLHFTRNGKSVDQIPPSDFYRLPGVLIDLRSNILQNANYVISPNDLQEWVNYHGQIPDGAVILIRTGWGEKAYDPAAYSGIKLSGQLNFPSLGREAARWIVDYKNRTNLSRGVIGVGLDVMSLDIGASEDMVSHVTLLEAGIYGIENVGNLDKLPAKGFTISVFPMKIGGGSGGPARVIAEIEGVPYTQSHATTTTTTSFAFTIILSTIMASFGRTIMCF